MNLETILKKTKDLVSYNNSFPPFWKSSIGNWNIGSRHFGTHVLRFQSAASASNPFYKDKLVEYLGNLVNMWPGKYLFAYNENLKQYLANLGCGRVFSCVQDKTEPDLVISYNVESEQWTFAFQHNHCTNVLTFGLWAPVESNLTLDRRPCKTMVTSLNELEMNIVQVPDSGPEVAIKVLKLACGAVRIELESASCKAVQVFSGQPNFAADDSDWSWLLSEEERGHGGGGSVVDNVMDMDTE